jgi:hypothetical protein
MESILHHHHQPSLSVFPQVIDPAKPPYNSKRTRGNRGLFAATPGRSQKPAIRKSKDNVDQRGGQTYSTHDQKGTRQLAMLTLPNRGDAFS